MKLTPFYATHKRALLKRLRSMRDELDATILLIKLANPDLDTSVEPLTNVEDSLSDVQAELALICQE